MEIEKVIAQAKLHVLRCITVVFKCVARPSSKTKGWHYSEYWIRNVFVIQYIYNTPVR